MVIILKYVLLGMLIYVFIIPIVEELVTIVVQSLEVLKGKSLLEVTKIQNEISKLSENKEKTSVHAIGF